MNNFVKKGNIFFDNIEGKTTKKRNYYLLFALCFFATYFAMLIVTHISGKSMVGLYDAHNQYWTTFLYQYNMIKNGDIATRFDFRIGLGEDKLTTLYYYGICNPIHYISLLFPADKLDIAWEVVMRIKLFLCGSSFLYYCQSRKKLDLYSVIGSLLYVFNNYLIVWGLPFWTFCDVCYTLPILVVGINSGIENNRKSGIMMLAIANFIQALNGFYFLYMQCSIGLIYMIVRLFIQCCLQTKKNVLSLGNVKRMLVSVLNVAMGYSIGLLIASPVLAPGLFAYLESSRNEEHIFYKASEFLPNLRLLFDFFSEFLTPKRELMQFWQLIVVFGIIGFVSNWKKHKELAIVFLFVFIGLICPVTGGILNGFSYITNRGYFFFQFVLAYIWCVGIREYGKMSVRKVKLSSIIMLIYFFIKIVTTRFEIRAYFCFLTIIFMIISYVRLKYNSQKHWKCFICSTAIILEIFHSAMMMGDFVGVGGLDTASRNTDRIALMDDLHHREVSEYVLDDLKKITDDNNSIWYRNDFSYCENLNQSLLAGYNSVGEYFSIMNPNVQALYRNIGMGTGFAKEGMFGWKTLETLCSVKYYDFKNFIYRQPEDDDTADFIDNDNLYSLGVFYDKAICGEVADKQGVERTAMMLDAVILNDEISVSDKYRYIEDKQYIFPVDYEICFQGEYSNDCYYINQGETVNFIISGEKIECGEVFLLFDDNGNYQGWHKVFVNGAYAMRYNISDCDMAIKLGEITEESRQDKYEVEISFDTEVELKNPRVVVYPTSIYEESYNAAIQRSNAQWKVADDEVSGRINAPIDGYILFTIPYSKYWIAKIDGIDSDVLRADDAFIALPVKAGCHSVQLVYDLSRERILSGVLLILGIGLFCGYSYMNKI